MSGQRKEQLWSVPESCSSGMTASEIFTLLLTRLFFAKLYDFVTARAPVPPATFGRPTPSLSWVSFAFRVRIVVVGGGGGWVVGWGILVVVSDFDRVGGSSSSSVSRTRMEPPERSREWPVLVDRVDATLTEVARLEGGGRSGLGMSWL